METFKRVTLGILVISVVVLAAIMGAVRLAIINIDYFKSEIEYLLERDLTPGFAFTGLSGDVNRFNPILRIENVSITLPDRSQPLFIDRLEMELDFWASWREQALVVAEVSGKLDKLELVKDESGVWSINDLPLSIDRDEGPAPEFRQVLALVPNYLNLSLSRLIVRDLKSGDTHQLERIEARINHVDEQFFVKLSAALPERLGHGVLVKSIVSPKSSLIYLNTTNLQLSPVANLFDLDTWGVQQGALDGELWINMAAYDVLGINGDLVLKNGMVQAAPDKPLLGITFKSRFSALNLEKRWRIANEMQRLSIDEHWVPSFRSQLEIVKGSKDRILSAWVDRMQIPSIPVVAGQWLPPRLSQQLIQGEFDGLLRDVWFQIDLERPREFYFGGRASDIGNRIFGNYPGISNINADIVAGNNRLGARVYGERVSLDFGNHFTAPIRFDQISLRATGQRHQDRLVLAVDDLELANADVKAGGRMWLEFDDHERPFTFIRASFRDADGRSTSQYIPRNHMPLEAQAWLDRGIKDGYVPSGEMQFHGRLNDIRKLARERAGEFFVDFTVERGDVYFSPGWLRAKNGQGRVLFHNVSVDIMLDRVSYDRIGNARARATIDNLDNPVLDLRIDANTSTRLAVDTWLDTPVGMQYRGVMSNLHDFGGDVGSSTSISLPLQKDQAKADVEVQLEFKNARTRSDDWGIDLSGINGNMKITPERFYARQIRARYFDDPVGIDIDTATSGADTVVTVGGAIETARLLNKLPENLTRNLQGKSNWRIDLSFARQSAPADKPFMRLRARSDLQNTGVDIPQPFAKPTAAPLDVTAEVDFFKEQIWFRADLGDEIKARGQLIPSAGRDFELNLLDIAFGSELRPKPEQGLHVYGSIAEVSVDDWARFIKSSGRASPALLQSAELSLDRARIFSRDASSVRLDLAQKDESYVGRIDSSIINGNFTIPLRPSARNPMLIDLDYLRIDHLSEDAEEASLQPSELVDFRLNSKAVVFHDMLFNDLYADARRDGDKLIIDRLGLKKDDLELQGTAEWEHNAASNSHLSSVSMTIRGDNLGQALSGMGFGDSMRDGSLTFIGGFTWPAPLVAFNVDNLVGDARFRVENGVLNNVEPGAGGRFVGLFSLGALPRRLALDFSDVLIKGMEFDQIVGTYRIEKGILTTEDTRMEGPQAVISISGETDIPNQGYDQRIVVTPKISQTLPLLGAVSAGSTVGWGLLLLQSLFKKAIDDAAEVEYRVSGSWDDPKIELVRAVDENQQELPQLDTDR